MKLEPRKVPKHILFAQKFTDQQLLDLVAQKLSVTEIAKRLNVSPAAVSVRMHRIRKDAAKDLATSSDSRNIVWANQVTASQILKKIHTAVDALLDETRMNSKLVTKVANAVERVLKFKNKSKERKAIIKEIASEIGKDRQLMLASARELREQVKLQLEIAKTLHSMQVVAEFQQSVLDVLENIDPDLREMVLKGLEEKRMQRIATLR